MASADEIRVSQANLFFILLEIQAQNKGTEIKGLKRAISQAKAAMLEPEISWVEKQIAELYN